jgi:hypothetical protein
LRAFILASAVALVIAAAAPALASAAYGAIAVNPKTGDIGLSVNKETQRDAKERAEKDCNGNCQIAVWVRNGCAALVETRTRYWAGIGRTKQQALREARRRAHNPDARRLVWICSGTG